MEQSVSWFMIQALVALAALWWGGRVGAGSTTRMWAWLAVGFFMLGCWGWLKHHPAVAVNALPLELLYYIEGTGAVPAFMLIVGIAYGRSRMARQKRVAALAMGLGIIYFLQGGMWMVQTAPQAAYGGSTQTTEGTLVLQSQEYSCVPAACATALRMLNVQTSESEMAELTQTRPGTGATLIRAMEALRTKLAGNDIGVNLYSPDYRQLQKMPMPALTPLQLESSQQHMVVLMGVRKEGVRIADPQAGFIFMNRDEFERVYTNQIIVFER